MLWNLVNHWLLVTSTFYWQLKMLSLLFWQLQDCRCKWWNNKAPATGRYSTRQEFYSSTTGKYQLLVWGKTSTISKYNCQLFCLLSGLILFSWMFWRKNPSVMIWPATVYVKIYPLQKKWGLNMESVLSSETQMFLN